MEAKNRIINERRSQYVEATKNLLVFEEPPAKTPNRRSKVGC